MAEYWYPAAMDFDVLFDFVLLHEKKSGMVSYVNDLRNMNNEATIRRNSKHITLIFYRLFTLSSLSTSARPCRLVF
jgi:hypothetical protein